jgi:polyisoprenoid-binding protein YceI
MSIEPGTYELGPQDGTLTVKTGRTGAIARAGHDLLMEVGAWGATVQVGPDGVPALLELTADANSLTVREGAGGVKALDDDDRKGIAQTIREEVLKGTTITFASRSVAPSGSGHLDVTGDLKLYNGVNEVSFALTIEDDGHVTGSAVVTQTRWGMKPYTALFGTLKVADEVTVAIDGRLQSR